MSDIDDIDDRINRLRSMFRRRLEQWNAAEAVRVGNLAAFARQINHPSATYLETAAAACRLAAQATTEPAGRPAAAGGVPRPD